jgi:hypothetical protein
LEIFGKSDKIHSLLDKTASPSFAGIDKPDKHRFSLGSFNIRGSPSFLARS